MTVKQTPTTCCLAILLGILIPSVVCSAQNDDTSATNAKRVLNQSTLGQKQFPWYSSETDDAAFVPFPKDKEEKEPKERPPQRESGSTWAFFAQMGYWTLFGIGLIVIAFILILAWYVIYRNQNFFLGLFRRLWKKEEYQERKRRLETLPEEARDMFDDLLGAARRAMESGDYRAALIYYFSHQLVWLDMHGLIRMHKGKTNHEYAREMRPATEVLGYYEPSMSLFESVYYGNHPISRWPFLGLWEDRHEFSRSVLQEQLRVALLPQRREETQQRRSNSITTHRDSFTMTVDLPEMRQDTG